MKADKAFEKWWETEFNPFSVPDPIEIWQAGFAAGQAAEREECRKIAQNAICVEGWNCAQESIVEAIRARGDK